MLNQDFAGKKTKKKNYPFMYFPVLIDVNSMIMCDFTEWGVPIFVSR